MIDIDFGDSEEEEGEEKEVQGGRECVAIRGGGSGATGSAGGQDGRGGSKGGVARGTAGREEGSKEDRESDEDFCILDSPTSTFVVHTCTYTHSMYIMKSISFLHSSGSRVKASGQVSTL